MHWRVAASLINVPKMMTVPKGPVAKAVDAQRTAAVMKFAILPVTAVMSATRIFGNASLKPARLRLVRQMKRRFPKILADASPTVANAANHLFAANVKPAVRTTTDVPPVLKNLAVLARRIKKPKAPTNAVVLFVKASVVPTREVRELVKQPKITHITG